MCNIQTEYKKIVITENKVNWFVSHKNEILIFFFLNCDYIFVAK